MSKTKSERIEGIDEKVAQLMNQKKKLVQQEKERQRKERNSRLCRRHGLLEKYMPDLAIITDEHFEMFIRRAINTSYGQDILAELVAKTGKTTNYVYIETPDDDDTGNGVSTPKAEPSRA